MRCTIWYHLCNLKNVKKNHGGVLLLVKLQAKACNFTKSSIPLWVFFTFFKLYEMYQISQNFTYPNFSGVSRLMDLLSDSREVIRNDVRMT